MSTLRWTIKQTLRIVSYSVLSREPTLEAGHTAGHGSGYTIDLLIVDIVSTPHLYITHQVELTI